MEVPKYIFDILSRLDTNEENLSQILAEFSNELSSDRNLKSFLSFFNSMNSDEVATIFRLIYNMTN